MFLDALVCWFGIVDIKSYEWVFMNFLNIWRKGGGGGGGGVGEEVLGSTMKI